MENEFKNYLLKFQIIDNYMKPAHLDFTNTKERVSFTLDILAEEFPNEDLAVSGVLKDLRKKWRKGSFDIKFLGEIK